MSRSFELEWLGGSAEQSFRKLRPGSDDLPWGTLDPSAYPAALVDRARFSWTQGAFFEYCTAASLATLLRAMLEAGAPVDLVGMAGEFVADEMLHVELNSRMAMELGGAAPCRADFERLAVEPSSGLSALERANEIIVKVCCVGETFSVPMLNATRKAATHPLTTAVLDRIVRDEGPHARLGWLYLEWVESRLGHHERQRLGRVALEAIREISVDWRGCEPTDVEPDILSDLGWMDPVSYAALARRVVPRHITEPLARFGIVPAPREVGELLAAPGSVADREADLHRSLAHAGVAGDLDVDGTLDFDVARPIVRLA